MIENIADAITRGFASTRVILATAGVSILSAVAYFMGFINDELLIALNLALSIATLLAEMFNQRSQNKDTKAIHIKIDELIKTVEKASNEFIGLEKKSLKEIEEMQHHL